MPDEGSLEARQARLAKNQALFRSVNEQVEQFAEKHKLDDAINFLCECASPDCGEQIEIAHDEYEAVRQEPRRFLVLAGHIFPEVEIVVEERNDYVIVEKYGAGGELAAAVDPRGSTEEAD
jgi:hypothetical protein